MDNLENMTREEIDKIIDERWKYYSAGLKENFVHKTSPETRELLEKLTNSLNRKISMKLDKKIFFWVMGILILVLSGMIGRISANYSMANENYINIVQRLTRMETKIDIVTEKK